MLAALHAMLDLGPQVGLVRRGFDWYFRGVEVVGTTGLFYIFERAIRYY